MTLEAQGVAQLREKGANLSGPAGRRMHRGVPAEWRGSLRTLDRKRSAGSYPPRMTNATNIGGFGPLPGVMML